MNLRKINLMHRMFGEIPDKKCGDCEHLITHQQSRKWFKCECYGLNSSTSSDFRKKWKACGLFNKPYNERPVMYLIKHASKQKEEIQCEGQVSMFDS